MRWRLRQNRECLYCSISLLRICAHPFVRRCWQPRKALHWAPGLREDLPQQRQVPLFIQLDFQLGPHHAVRIHTSGGAGAAKCHVKCTFLGVPGDAGTVNCGRTILKYNAPVVILLHCTHFFGPSCLSRQVSGVAPDQRVSMCHRCPFAQQLGHCLFAVRQGL